MLKHFVAVSFWWLVALLLATLAEAEEINGKSAVPWVDTQMTKLQKKAKMLHEIMLTAPELISEQGYPVEIHHVETPDGYILEMHRIPYGKRGNASSTKDRPTVYLQHCFLCSSSDWIMNTPDNALAYILADFGYDVWMGNARGNTYSRRHVFLEPDDPLFWKFSWNEMGQYDVPTMIDYVLNVTGHKKLHYIGFSMGTTIFFTMMHHHPHFNEKISGMVALAPVAYTKYVKGPLSTILPFNSALATIMEMAGVRELLPSGRLMDYLVARFCANSKISSIFCHNILFLLTGPNPDHINQDFLPLILSHTPAGTSLQTLIHFLQIGRADKFQMYDYGFFGNFRKYGSSSPPEYNMTRVTTPVAIFYSDNDWLAPKENVKRLVKNLPNVIGFKSAPPTFTHLDFVWAKNAARHIYKRVLKVLSMF